jgi:hypothetical protein
MENTKLQSTFSTIDNDELEEKIDIKGLVLPSKPIGIPNMESVDIKEEPLDMDFIPVHERTKQIGHAFLHDENNTSGELIMVHERINLSSFATNEVFQPEIILRLTPQSGVLPSKPTDTENEVFQSEIERKIKKLFEEFDMMSVHEYDLTRVKKVKQLFKKYQTDNQKEHILEEGLEEKSNELAKVEEEFQKTNSLSKWSNYPNSIHEILTMSQNSILEILAMSSKNYLQLINFLSNFSSIHELSDFI